MDDDILRVLVFALEHEQYRLERAGRIHRYPNLLVCSRCFREHIIDYEGLMLKHGGDGYRCELCGDSGFWMFDVFLAAANRRVMEHVRGENWRRLMEWGDSK